MTTRCVHCARVCVCSQRRTVLHESASRFSALLPRCTSTWLHVFERTGRRVGPLAKSTECCVRRPLSLHSFRHRLWRIPVGGRLTRACPGRSSPSLAVPSAGAGTAHFHRDPAARGHPCRDGVRARHRVGVAACVPQRDGLRDRRDGKHHPGAAQLPRNGHVCVVRAPLVKRSLASHRLIDCRISSRFHWLWNPVCTTQAVQATPSKAAPASPAEHLARGN